MASGQTILHGWRSLGRWAIWYFVIYLFIVTFVFGAAVSSTAALAVDAAFPGVLPLWAWAAPHSRNRTSTALKSIPLATPPFILSPKKRTSAQRMDTGRPQLWIA